MTYNLDSKEEKDYSDPAKRVVGKGFGLSSEDYIEVANSVGWALTQGIPVEEQDVKAFVWITMTNANGSLTDNDMDQIQFKPNEVLAVVDQRGNINGMTLQESHWLRTAMDDTDVAISDETFNNLIGSVVATPTMGLLRQYAARALPALFAGGTIEGQAAASGILPGLSSPNIPGLGTAGKLVGGILKHPKVATGLGLMAGLVAMGVGQETGDDITYQGMGEEPIVGGDSSQYYVVDGATGQTVPLPNEEAANLGLTQGSAVNGAQSYDLGPYLQSLVDSGIMSEQDAASIAQMQGQFEDFNPDIAGHVTLPFNTFPYGVDLRGVPLSEQPSLTQPPAPPLGGFPVGEEETLGNRDIVAGRKQGDYLSSLDVAPGGVIMPNAFKEWSNGQTLIEMAANAAAEFGVPIDVLYGLVTQESGWNPYAVGDNGQSHGLVQIYSPAHPDISAAQANNPAFALRWAANNLLQNYQRYGSWELAVVAHRSPAGAQHLANNGEFLSELDRSYLGNVSTYAMQSSLGNTIFGGRGSALSEAGLAATASPAPPYRKPDRATLEEFIDSSFGEVYGREVTPDEMEEKVKQLESLYKKAYTQSVRNFRGLESTDVNPQDQFVRSLKESGEGKFQKSSERRSSMHQYMGNVAAILNGSY